MEVTILGTSSAVPLLRRNLSATVLGLDHEYILFDCGEGTQFQLKKIKLHPTKIHTIAITHLHGDHCFGLPGLISSINYSNKSDKLTVIGPKGIADILETAQRHQQFFADFPIDIIELEFTDQPVVILDTPFWQLLTVSLDHRVPAFGYRFQQKTRPGHIDLAKAEALGLIPGPSFKDLKEGKPVLNLKGEWVSPREVIGPDLPGLSFTYVTDTRYCSRSVDLARGTDLLMHEATYLHVLTEKAKETGHSTAREAGKVAREASAGGLVLFHYSARYQDLTPLLNEARSEFPTTRLGDDFMKLTLGGHQP